MEYITKTFRFDGKKYYVRGKTEKEANEKLIRRKMELEEGRALKSNNYTVAQWADICINTYKHFNSEKYEKSYMTRIRSCILDVIGSIPIKKVRPMDCQNCINRQAANSKYQIKQTKQMLEFLFNHAIDNDLIIKNPVKNITMPDGSVEERRPLTDYEEQIFLSIDDKRFLLFRCMYYCGCRPSEVRSLEGRDIQEHDGVHILHIRGTKTDKSERYVPIPSELYDEIKGTPPFQKICLNASGNPFDEKAYQRAWNSLKREMNIKMGCKMYRNALIPPYPLAPDLVPYDLRHTYCTNLSKKHVPVEVAQKLMGHSDIRTTINIYHHIDMEQIIETAKILDAKSATTCATT